MTFTDDGYYLWTYERITASDEKNLKRLANDLKPYISEDDLEWGRGNAGEKICKNLLKKREDFLGCDFSLRWFEDIKKTDDGKFVLNLECDPSEPKEIIEQIPAFIAVLAKKYCPDAKVEYAYGDMCEKDFKTDGFIDKKYLLIDWDEGGWPEGFNTKDELKEYFFDEDGNIAFDEEDSNLAEAARLLETDEDFETIIDKMSEILGDESADEQDEANYSVYKYSYAPIETLRLNYKYTVGEYLDNEKER